MSKVHVSLIALLLVSACTSPTAEPPAAPVAVDRTALMQMAKPLFGTLQPASTTDDPAVEEARVSLGRALYYETRLSKNHDLSCNSCHDLAKYGVDTRETNGKR